MNLYNDDCFNVFPKIKDKTIDLFILDLPYGQTSCKWDCIIDLNEMWKHIKRIMKPNAIIIFFTTAKFGYSLIHSNPKWFRYDLVWEKSRKVGFLSANKMPLRKHELMYVFSKDENENKDDKEIKRNKELREYAEKVFKYIGKNRDEIEKEIGNKGIIHFYTKGKQFDIPTKKNYEKLTKVYKLDEMEDYLNYEELENKYEKPPAKEESTYNSQKTEGKPYKQKQGNQTNLYGIEDKENVITENKGTRHPHSILQYAEDHENIYIFSKDNKYDLENERNKELREYANNVKDYINESLKIIDKKIGNQGIHHFYSFTSTQFGIPTKKNYEKLTELYKLNKMEDYLNYEELQSKWEAEPQSTYNSQLEEGKPYKQKQGNQTNLYGIEDKEKVITENKGTRHPHSILKYAEDHENIYIFKKEQGTYNPQKTEGKPYKKKQGQQTNLYGKEDTEKVITENKGDRHPTTILKFNNPKKSLHRTQKPTDLLEWLIKSYSNENDLICDFTMGSGSTGEACLNTNRRFIGIEKNEEIFKIAYKRLKTI